METTQLEQFRERLYTSFERRADATMDLVDALSSDTTARSAVELSLNPAFRRGYGSLHDAVTEWFRPSKPWREWKERARRASEIQRVLAPELPPPVSRPFWLFGIDSLPISRPHARTLEDRSFVHQAGAVAGNKPITIGHSYSPLVGLPEKAGAAEPPWVLPLGTRRIPSQRTPTEVAIEQLRGLVSDPALPWQGQLVAAVLDSAYSGPALPGTLAEEANLVVISRLRSDRVLYHQPPPRSPGDRGHPSWYGPRFALEDPATWGPPAEQREFESLTPRGRKVVICLKVWHNLLTRGRRDLPMHRYPFTVIRVSCRDEHGRPLFRRPLWLGVFGQRRMEVDAKEAQQAYAQRFDQEHYHRFSRQRLHFDAYQTPDTGHEENWVDLTVLAYAQLFVARHLAISLPRPWERYQAVDPDIVASPSRVQRDFGRIIRQLGTPARSPKTRGKAPGRAPNTSPGRRPRLPLVKKAALYPVLARAPA
jgi:hypothetical protein